MNNPFELHAPSEPLNRIHDFARDLAYGVAQGWWGPRFTTLASISEGHWLSDTRDRGNRQVFADLIKDKWENVPPSDQLLVMFGYFITLSDNGSQRIHLLTASAVGLLEKPFSPPFVFISYKRDQSSALALLVEARLRIAGNPNPFIDKNIIPGDDWHDRLEKVVNDAKYFVALIGPETLKSPYVRKEIAWAEAAGCTIISIWHGCEVGEVDDCPPILQAKHAIGVTGESAKEYEAAINELLNAMGYATY